MTSTTSALAIFKLVKSAIVGWIPNVLTLINLCCGGLIIYWGLHDRVELAVIAMILCLVADFLDGLAARALDAHHRFGADLDSLADVVSFGVAPALLMVEVLSNDIHSSLAYLPLGFAAAAAIRLAKFNVETREGDFFYGLPSPAAAVCLFGLYIVVRYGDGCDVCHLPLFHSHAFILSMVTILSTLMITDLPHFHLKNVTHRRHRWPLSLLLVCSIVLVSWLGKAAISSIVVFYIFLSLIYFQIRRS